MAKLRGQRARKQIAPELLERYAAAEKVAFPDGAMPLPPEKNGLEMDLLVVPDSEKSARQVEATKRRLMMEPELKAEVARVNRHLRKYGLEIDESVLAAEHAMLAGYPVKGLSGLMGKDWLLYRIAKDLLFCGSPMERRHLMELAGQVLGLVAAPGMQMTNMFTAVRFNELGAGPLKTAEHHEARTKEEARPGVRSGGQS